MKCQQNFATFWVCCWLLENCVSAYNIWQFLCLSRVLTLCHLHWHVIIRYQFFIFKYFMVIFAKQSADVLRILIPTEKYPGTLSEAEFWAIMNSIPFFLTSLFSDTKDLQCERIENELQCIFSHFSLAPLFFPFLLHFSFFYQIGIIILKQSKLHHPHLVAGIILNK